MLCAAAGTTACREATQPASSSRAGAGPRTPDEVTRELRPGHTRAYCLALAGTPDERRTVWEYVVRPRVVGEEQPPRDLWIEGRAHGDGPPHYFVDGAVPPDHELLTLRGPERDARVDELLSRWCSGPGERTSAAREAVTVMIRYGLLDEARLARLEACAEHTRAEWDYATQPGFLSVSWFVTLHFDGDRLTRWIEFARD